MSYPISVVPFHGDSVVTLDADGNQYIVMKPIAEALGLSWATQTAKLQGDARFNCFDIETVGMDGKSREMLCIPLKKLNNWLFSINPNEVHPNLKEKVIQYQEECFEVLHDYWQGMTVSCQAKPQNPFDQIDKNKLDSLTRLDKSLAWKYLDSLGIERPTENRTSYRHCPYDLNELAEKLKPIAKEYDANYFFVQIDELNKILKYQKRATITWLMQQKLLYPGEFCKHKNTYRMARNCNSNVADQYFNGQRKRVYVISWKVLSGKEAVQ